jgi:hypothetical protein
MNREVVEMLACTLMDDHQRRLYELQRELPAENVRHSLATVRSRERSLTRYALKKGNYIELVVCFGAQVGNNNKNPASEERY